MTATRPDTVVTQKRQVCKRRSCLKYAIGLAAYTLVCVAQASCDAVVPDVAFVAASFMMLTNFFGHS